MKVHEKCRLIYGRKRSNPPVKKRKLTDSSDFEQDVSNPNEILASDYQGEEDPFDFQNNCFICNEFANTDTDIINIAAENDLNFYSNLRSKSNDESDKIIIDRLQSRKEKKVFLYHERCKDDFLSNPTSTVCHDVRSIDEVLETIYNYIENSGKFKFQFDEIKELLGEDSISYKTLFERLKKHYQEKIFIDQSVGRKPVIFYNIFVANDVFKRWHVDRNITDMEKKLILATAAEILKADAISSTSADTDESGTNFLDDINSGIPQSIRDFVEYLIYFDKTNNTKHTKKIDTICHSLMNLIVPKFSSKLQMLLGIYIIRKTGKKQIVDLLNKMGVSASYDAVHSYEKSRALDPNLENFSEDDFVRYIFEITERNVSNTSNYLIFKVIYIYI